MSPLLHQHAALQLPDWHLLLQANQAHACALLPRLSVWPKYGTELTVCDNFSLQVPEHDSHGQGRTGGLKLAL